jgi:hypothetical protein
MLTPLTCMAWRAYRPVPGLTFSLQAKRSVPEGGDHDGHGLSAFAHPTG